MDTRGKVQSIVRTTKTDCGTMFCEKNSSANSSESNAGNINFLVNFPNRDYQRRNKQPDLSLHRRGRLALGSFEQLETAIIRGFSSRF
jgi:hypothetical protein